MTDEEWAGLAIAVPTFQRNDQLLEVLVSIGAQSVRPEIVIVVDNNPDDAARRLVEDFREKAPFELQYLSMGRNSGPAGAFAAALVALNQHRSKPKWMLCRGDDNPFDDTGTIATLRDLSRTPPGLSSVGLGIYGKLHPSPKVKPPTGPAFVDFIPGGGVPTYNIQSLARHGLNFNENLFFGFEELELGLRVKQAGLRLLAARVAEGSFVIAPKRSSPWRIYFGERNWIIVTRLIKPRGAVLMLAARSLRSSVRRLVIDRSPPDALACFLGGVDGLMGAPARRKYIPR